MPFDKPRLFFGDGAANISAKVESTPRLQDSLPRETVADEELGLSAELQVLASHLRGEADSLAGRYAPASRAASASARNRGFGRRWVWQFGAAAVAGLALVAWQIDRWAQSPHVAIVVQSPTSGPVVAPQQPTIAAIPQTASVPLAPPVLSSASPSSTANVDPAAFRHSQGVAEVGIDAPAVERHPPADQVEMLRIQVLGFEKVIRKLQTELIARDAAQMESQRRIESLQAEVAELHKQLDTKSR